MDLNKEQRKQLQAILLQAFPTKTELAQMIDQELDERLNSITEGGNLKQIVFELIEWARSQGRLQDLIRGACSANSGNAELLTFAQKSGVDIESSQPTHHQSSINPPPTEPAPMPHSTHLVDEERMATTRRMNEYTTHALVPVQPMRSGPVIIRSQIEEYTRELHKKTFNDHQQLLVKVANYFIRTIPRSIDGLLVLALEDYLNALYIQSWDEAWFSQLRNVLRDTLGKTSMLMELIKYSNDGLRDAQFGSVAKELGENLAYLGLFEPRQ